jgi:ATP phosphoribosyltransferase
MRNNMRAQDRLRIAIQKSGRLSEPARDILQRAGLVFRESRDRLFCYGESLPIDLLLVRDDDIPGLIAEGVCDLGIVGKNVLEEQAVERELTGKPEAFEVIKSLGFGRCRLSVAVPNEWDFALEKLNGTRIATSYPSLLQRWLNQNAINAEVVMLSGSVEIAPRLGKAESICDIVSSGATLAANQLKEVATVTQSEAVLAGPAQKFLDARAELADLLLRRLDNVLSVRVSKMLMLQAERNVIPELLKMLPDADVPTLMNIDGQPNRLALQALCTQAITWQRLEDMKRAGAERLVVMPVEQILV